MRLFLPSPELQAGVSVSNWGRQREKWFDDENGGMIWSSPEEPLSSVSACMLSLVHMEGTSVSLCISGVEVVDCEGLKKGSWVDQVSSSLDYPGVIVALQGCMRCAHWNSVSTGPHLSMQRPRPKKFGFYAMKLFQDLKARFLKNYHQNITIIFCLIQCSLRHESYNRL